jgi:hypothetical protein
MSIRPREIRLASGPRPVREKRSASGPMNRTSTAQGDLAGGDIMLEVWIEFE